MVDLNDRASTKEWRKVVEGASEYWKALAEQYSIIVIPDFMDENSEEYKFI